MKILKGTLTETRFEFPTEGEEKKPMTMIAQRQYKEDTVAYMADELGLHRVTNEGSDFAVSLHRKMLHSLEILISKLTIVPCSVHAPQCRQRRVPYLR